MKLGDIKGEARGFLDLGNRGGTGSEYQKIEWTLYPGPDELVKTVRGAHPQGVNGILIGLNKVPGYHLTVGKNGIIAILIGLLLPAVQKMAAGNSSDLRLLAGALGPKGQIGFAMGDGSVRRAHAFNDNDNDLQLLMFVTSANLSPLDTSPFGTIPARLPAEVA